MGPSYQRPGSSDCQDEYIKTFPMIHFFRALLGLYLPRDWASLCCNCFTNVSPPKLLLASSTVVNPQKHSPINLCHEISVSEPNSWEPDLQQVINEYRVVLKVSIWSHGHSDISFPFFTSISSCFSIFFKGFLSFFNQVIIYRPLDQISTKAPG